MAKLKFTIKRIKYRQDVFAEVIGKNIELTDDNDKKIINRNITKSLTKEVVIRGVFPISLDIGDKFNAYVNKHTDIKTNSIYFEIDPNHGLPKRLGLESEDALADFLRRKINIAPKENKKLVKWKIPIKTCNNIIKYLGTDAINKIIENPTCLLLYDDLKLNDDKIFEMQRILKSNANLQKIVIALKTSNIPMQTILDLYDIYQDKTLENLLTNPYQICYDGKLSFSLADKIAFDKNFEIKNPHRIKTAIIDFLRYKKICGNICIYKEQFFKKYCDGQITIFEYLNKTSSYNLNELYITREDIEEQINVLISEKRIVEEKIDKQSCIYLVEMFEIEKQLLNTISYLLDNTYNQKFCEKQDVLDFLDNYEQSTNTKLDRLQKAAVMNALQNKISILTGGPGTGKTHTVAVIVNAIKSISKQVFNKEPNFLLAAPTGKAAERMTELTGEKASTIHRLLELRLGYATDVIIDADFVIVDEGSMIDIELMDVLLKKLSDNTRILIVGDYNQLPSVGPGKILNDFIDSGVIPQIQLTTIFRQAQGSAIVESANKIINGYNSKHPQGIILTNDPNRNFKFIKDTYIESTKNKIFQQIDEYLANGVSIKNIQILTPKRQGELGVEVLNYLFQEKYNPNPILYLNKKTGIKFKIGDKVIHTQNNYELQVFNGYIGEIVDIDDTRIVNGTIKPIITVEYENMDSPIIYEKGEDISQLDLAYALTVHKSQGSEYPYVIMPINKEQSIMLNRNLLYTAVTRAKTECMIIGDDTYVDKAINTELSFFERISGIKYKLQEKYGNC